MARDFKTGGLPEFPGITNNPFEEAIEKTLKDIGKTVIINNRRMPRQEHQK